MRSSPSTSCSPTLLLTSKPGCGTIPRERSNIEHWPVVLHECNGCPGPSSSSACVHSQIHPLGVKRLLGNAQRHTFRRVVRHPQCPRCEAGKGIKSQRTTADAADSSAAKSWIEISSHRCFNQSKRRLLRTHHPQHASNEASRAKSSYETFQFGCKAIQP